MPYPNVAQDRDLAKGTKQVKIGGKSVAIAGAHLRTSTGNEAGTAGGGLIDSRLVKKYEEKLIDKTRAHQGMEWEHRVGTEVEAQEMNVRILCADCGQKVTEFDVLMDNGIVKECKSSWNALSPTQLATQIDLLERVGLLGPGRTLHVAIPKGARGRLDKKFADGALTKDDMRGRIQEH